MRGPRKARSLVCGHFLCGSGHNCAGGTDVGGQLLWDAGKNPAKLLLLNCAIVELCIVLLSHALSSSALLKRGLSRRDTRSHNIKRGSREVVYIQAGRCIWCTAGRAHVY